MISQPWPIPSPCYKSQVVSGHPSQTHQAPSAATVFFPKSLTHLFLCLLSHQPGPGCHHHGGITTASQQHLSRYLPLAKPTSLRVSTPSLLSFWHLPAPKLSTASPASTPPLGSHSLPHSMPLPDRLYSLAYNFCSHLPKVRLLLSCPLLLPVS